MIQKSLERLGSRKEDKHKDFMFNIHEEDDGIEDNQFGASLVTKTLVLEDPFEEYE